MSLLVDKTIREYNELLASSEPAPGGGSTAALSGVLGSALSMMVVNLSRGRKFYEALDAGIKEEIEQSFDKISALNAGLVELTDEDTRAFNAFMAALKSKDEAAIEKASIYALEVPLKAAESCLEILRNQRIIAQYGNKNAVSDVGVGALLACAGLEGAALNVKINLPGIRDAAVKSDATQKIDAFLEEGMNLRARIMDAVNARLG